ncbi:MAG: hypothetical protein V4538_15585 [Bacteroidota bacterium]
MSDISVEKGTFTKQVDFALGTAINSAATIDLGASDGNTIYILGTTPISSLGTPPQIGVKRTCIFVDALTLTHSVGLVLFGAANIVTVAGDRITFVATSLTVWEQESMDRQSGYTNGQLNANGLANGSVTALKLGDAAVIPSKMATNTAFAMTDATETLTASDFVTKKIFTLASTADRAKTTPTAVAIIALLTSYQVGTSFEVVFVQTANFVMTLAPGVGVTIVGKDTVGFSSGTFLAVVTAPTTLTLYRK